MTFHPSSWSFDEVAKPKLDHEWRRAMGASLSLCRLKHKHVSLNLHVVLFAFAHILTILFYVQPILLTMDCYLRQDCAYAFSAHPRHSVRIGRKCMSNVSCGRFLSRRFPKCAVNFVEPKRCSVSTKDIVHRWCVWLLCSSTFSFCLPMWLAPFLTFKRHVLCSATKISSQHVATKITLLRAQKSYGIGWCRHAWF